MSSVRRVLMTADTVGGVWTYALDLARGLSAHGISTLLAAMGGPVSAAQRAAAQDIPGLVIEARPYRVEWMVDCEADVARAGDWLLALAHDWRPDIVHLNGYAHAVLPFACPVVVVAHSCVRSWWMGVHGALPPVEWEAYGQRVAQGLAAADLVVAPTVAFLRQIERLYQPLVQAQPIWNGRDAGGFAPDTKQPLILSAGRLWDPAKNVALLAAVAEELAWPVVVAGDWRDPDGMGEPPPGVRCLGVVDQPTMADWMGRASIFVLPARYEPFGLAVLEAALSGCALVLGDVPTLRELWTGAALFVDPLDRRALAQTLVELQENLARVTALGTAARKRAAAFSAERMSRAYAAAYGQLAGVRQAPAHRLFTLHH